MILIELAANETRESLCEHRHNASRRRDCADAVSGPLVTRIIVPVLLALSVSVSACGLTSGQTDATLKFADAATQFGNAASTELVKMRDQTVAMNTALYRVPDLPLADRRDNSTRTVTKPIVQADIETGQYKNLADYFASDWYATFLSGPIAIAAYGDAITSMMKADNSAEVKAASDNLAAALKAIPASPVANASSAAISGLSQQLTEWWLAEMKAHAVRSVAQSANEAIAEICSKVADDFAARPSAKNLPWRYRETARQLYVAGEQGMRNNKSFPQARSDSLAAFVLAKSNLDDAKTVFPKIVEAGNKCVVANAALVKALSNNEYSIRDIEDFFQQAKGLYTNVKTLTGNQ
jgi:hypothetical protein